MFFWKESIISVWFQDSLSDNDLEETLKLQREDKLKALHRQLMRKKAKLEELENSDESLVAEMAALLSKIEEAQEEKATIQKQMAGVEEKLKKLFKKKHKLENSNEEKIRESNEAKCQLQREIKEIKTKMENLRQFNGKVERVQSESHNLWLQSVESKIETKEKELECPVCLEVASPPIFCCHEQHLICRTCREKVHAAQNPFLFTLNFRCRSVLSAGRSILRGQGYTGMQKGSPKSLLG